MPNYSDYELYEILEGNGYKPSNENLAALKEGIEAGSMILCESRLELKDYPINSKEQLISAMNKFGDCKEKDRSALALLISHKMTEYDYHKGVNTLLTKYLPKYDDPKDFGPKAFATAKKSHSISDIKEALINSGYKDTDDNVFKAHDALEEGLIEITEEPAYDTSHNEIKYPEGKGFRRFRNKKDFEDSKATGKLVVRKIGGKYVFGAFSPSGLLYNVHEKDGLKGTDAHYEEEKDKK